LYECHSGLGSPRPEVSLYDDFERSRLTRSHLHNDMPLSDLE